MTMKNILYRAIILATVASSLSSCLKDDSLVLDPSKGVNVIEFANPSSPAATGTPFALYTFAYEATASPTLPITVSYSGPELVAPRDITVKFTVGDTSQINPYNRATQNNYVLLQPASYTLSTNEVVIKAGTSKASFNVLLKPSSFNFSAAEVLPLKITEVSSGTISGNYNTILLGVSAKNAYDGIYAHQAGSFVQRYQNPTTPTVNDGLNGSIAENSDLTLTTVGPTTVQIANLRWHGNASGIGGIDNLQLTVDPATNLITMKAAGNASLKTIPGKVNRYDPATKSFILNFDWNQTANKREVALNIVFKGAR